MSAGKEETRHWKTCFILRTDINENQTFLFSSHFLRNLYQSILYCKVCIQNVFVFLNRCHPKINPFVLLRKHGNPCPRCRGQIQKWLYVDRLDVLATEPPRKQLGNMEWNEWNHGFNGFYSYFVGNFHPEPWGRWTQFDIFDEHIFRLGWNLQPPTIEMKIFTSRDPLPEPQKEMNHLNQPLIIWVVATQTFLEFSPRTLGKMNPFWRAYFSAGLVQPPTSNI